MKVGSNVTLSSGTSILLKPGFHAKAANTFLAMIAPCTASLEEPRAPALRSINKQLKIGPNPVLNQLSVVFKFPFPKQQTQLEVYDCLGRRVIHQQLEPNAQYIQLDVSDLKNGIYYLNMANGRERMMRKFVKLD